MSTHGLLISIRNLEKKYVELKAFHWVRSLRNILQQILKLKKFLICLSGEGQVKDVLKKFQAQDCLN